MPCKFSQVSVWFGGILNTSADARSMSSGRRGHRTLLSDAFSDAEPHGLSSPSGRRLAQLFAVLWTFSVRSDAPGVASRGKAVAAPYPGSGSSDRLGRQRQRPHQQIAFAEAGLAPHLH